MQIHSSIPLPQIFSDNIPSELQVPGLALQAVEGDV